MEGKPKPLPALTGVRALAAMLVVLGHLSHMGLSQPQVDTLWSTLPVFSHRTTGVGLFFALSGFVIFYNYSAALADGQMSVRAYLWRRVARLYPLYLLAVTSLIPLGISNGDPPILLAAQYLGVQSWINDYRAYFGWHGGAWSVSTEIAFYVAFPFVVAPLARRVSRAGAVVAWLGCLGALVAIWLVRFRLGNAFNGVDFWVYAFPPTRLLEFAMGALTARIFLLRDGARLPFRAGPVAAAALVAALLLVPGTENRPLVYPLLLVPLFTPTLYWLAESRGRVARLTGWGPMVRAGEASYALYLFHGFGLWPTRELLEVLGLTSLPARLVVGLPIATALAWAVAFALHRLVELPAQRRLLRRLRPARPAAEPVPVAAAPAGP